MNTERKLQQVLYNTPKNTPVYALLNYSLKYLNNRTEQNRETIIQQHTFITAVYPEQLTPEIVELIKEIMN